MTEKYLIPPPVRVVAEGDVRPACQWLELPSPLLGSARVAVTQDNVVVAFSFCTTPGSIATDQHARQWSQQLFHASNPIPVGLFGTEFQRRVWSGLLRIRAGTTCSYGELASAIGSPRASRAVGAALAANPVGWLVPCHRVVRGSGALGGYAGGIKRKQFLLDTERQYAAAA